MQNQAGDGTALVATDTKFDSALSKLEKATADCWSTWNAVRPWVPDHYDKLHPIMNNILQDLSGLDSVWRGDVLRKDTDRSVGLILESSRLLIKEQSKTLSALNQVVIRWVKASRVARSSLRLVARFQNEVETAYAKREDVQAAARLADARRLSGRIAEVFQAMESDSRSAQDQTVLIGIKAQALLSRRLELFTAVLVGLTSGLIAVTWLASRGLLP